MLTGPVDIDIILLNDTMLEMRTPYIYIWKRGASFLFQAWIRVQNPRKTRDFTCGNMDIRDKLTFVCCLAGAWQIAVLNEEAL